MKENWQQVKEIFVGVLSQAPENRLDFISQRCSGNEGLQHELESLLSSYDSADLFLESPAVGEVADSFAVDKRELKKGDFLDHYRIIRKIGTGGMGKVYLAEDRKLEREVAIKTLNSTFDAGDSNLKRFFQEAKAASGLNHPNIIVVYDIGESDGLHYIAIEFVKGQTLSAALKTKDLSLSEVVDTSIQIVNALGAAHAVGIIHRDIKSDNIMLRDDGIVKVLDFGLAKLTEKNKPETDDEARTLLNTHAGMILGTVAYMSPEQTRGKEIDARSDLWSFGVVLFQMLAGRLPFPGETTSDIIAAILKTETPHLAEFVNDIPAELEHIVRKSLQKNPNARYQTAGELLDDLKYFRRSLEFEHGERPLNSRVNEVPDQEIITDAKFAHVTAGRTGYYSSGISSFISVAASEVRQHPRVSLVGAAMFAAVLFAGFFGLSRLNSTTASTGSFQNMRLAKLTFEGNTTNIVSVSPDGKYIAYVINDNGKQSLMARQVATSAVVQLVPPAAAEYSGLTFSPDGNYIYYNFSKPDSVGELFQIPVLGGNPRKIIDNIDGAAAFSPDGKLMAFVRSRTSLMLADAKGSGQRILNTITENELLESLAWNPTGKSIIASSFSTMDSRFHLIEYSLDNGSEKRLSTGNWLVINGLKWLLDGSGIIISARDTDTQFSQVWEIPYPDGTPRRITNDFSTYLDVSLTADNKFLVAIKEDRLYNIWVSPDATTENTRRITLDEGRDEGIAGVVKTADGKIVYTVRKTGTIDLWTVNEDGTDNRQLTFDQGTNFSPVISPNGKSIVFVSDRTGIQKIWRMNLDGGNQAELTDSNDTDGYPSFTPDGNWIVYQRTNSKTQTTIWKIATEGGEPIQLTKFDSARAVVSPNGNLIACDYVEANPDISAKIAIIPVNGGRPLKILELPDVYKSMFRWTADGKALIYIDNRDRTDNLWSQTLDNSPPKQLTFFVSGRISKFDINRDGKGFVLSRGQESSDVVMISDFR